MIADGLWEALLTTAIGLSIALPCLLAAQAYKAWEDKILDSFCIRLNRLSLSFEIDNQEQAAVHKIPERKAA
jgi:biopolymer transport protein ExbB